MTKMVKELEELRKGKHQCTWKNPLGEMNAPFSRRIREVELTPKFKMPTEKYSGSKDPVSHMESFVHQMEVQNATRSAMCRMFPSTLTDYAKTWFRKLPPKETCGLADCSDHLPSICQRHTRRPTTGHWSICRVKVEHDEARKPKRPKKESPKPALAKKFQNHPPNRSTYRPPPPQHRERYLVRRTPPTTTPPLREVARVASEEDWYNHYTPLNAS
ncbi:hypothetical protein LWI29_017289 [Acer saccharum]|uniref:Retrotransposon gag domain-containing protein n=1 Tax=Acer saccharum TaxID=4024 RepID=A0AA39SDS7_ACESA|nr:hypothetical protein LWI29_017289 [Acer saccharum]